MEQVEPSHANHSPLVCHFTGRCHIAESNRAVLRYFISCLKDKEITWRKLPRKIRRNYIRDIIECHAANRGLYNFVMRGH